jgi:hypothetical protein
MNNDLIIKKFLNIKIISIFVMMVVIQFMLYFYHFQKKIELEKSIMEIDFNECKKFFATELYSQTDLIIRDNLINELKDYEKKVNKKSDLKIITADPEFIRIEFNKIFLDQYKNKILNKFGNLQTICAKTLLDSLDQSIKLMTESMKNLNYDIDKSILAEIVFNRSIAVLSKNNLKILKNIKVTDKHNPVTKKKALLISLIMSLILSGFFIFFGIILFSKSK